MCLIINFSYGINMELRLLRYFLAVCEERNFTRAADKMHVSQPALSKQIKDLEDELGVNLFIREHRKVSLTQEGYFLRDRAQDILNLTDATEKSLQKDKIISGVLRIGAGESPLLNKVMKLLGEIAIKYPDVQIDIDDANGDEIEEKINNGIYDFGIIMGNRDLSNFESLILPEKNKFVAYFDQSLPLAKKKEITLHDLIDYPIVMSKQSGFLQKLKTDLGNDADKLKIIAKSNLLYNSSLLAHETNSILIGYRDLSAIKDPNFVMRPLSPEIWDPMILIWKKNSAMSNLCAKFLEELKAQIKA
ncbi:LysR family transcriptional regulator [Lactobacillus hamsteri]